MTSEMEAAFRAAHEPRDLAQAILDDLERERANIEQHEQVYGGGVPAEDPQVTTNRALLEVDAAIGELRNELAALKAKPPKPHRTGSAARMNPDDIRLARFVLTGTAAFGAAAFIVSFGGQLAMAPYTRLQPELFWFVPFVIEAPIILLSFMIAVFRRRKQSTAMPWIIVLALTALSSGINFLHVWIESGGLPEPGDWAGATVMALAPWLVLLLFEEFVRLAVKPTIEAPEPAPAAARRTTPNRKGTKK